MKDKIFLPSVITTLVLLIIFLLICINNQVAMSKTLLDRVEVLTNRVATLSQSQNMNLAADLMKLQKETAKLRADFQSHDHRNMKLISIENVDKGK